MGTYDCMQAKTARGIVSKRNADTIQKYYERYYKTHKANPNPPEDIHDVAMQDAMQQWTREIEDKRYQVIKQFNAQKVIKDVIMTGFTAKDIGMDAGKLMNRVLSLIESSDGHQQFANFRNVVQREHSLRQQAQAMMQDVLIEFNTFGLAKSQAAKMNDIVALLLGDSKAVTHVAAKANAKAIRKVLDFLHEQYKHAGGIIGKLDHYVPQSHSKDKIQKVGVEQWIAEILPRLDLAKMIDYDTGQPFTANAIYPLLKDVYDGIVTQGWNNREINSALQGRSMGNKHKDPRILHFKDAQSYLEYNAQFGAKPAFVEIVSYMTYMTRDIAVMQTLGPNPQATLRFIKNLISHEVNVNPHKHDLTQFAGTGGTSAEAIFKRFESLFDTVMGRTNQMADSQWGKRFAETASATRSLSAAAKLGSATVASVNDVGTAVLVAGLNGLPATKHVYNLLKQLNPLNKKDRRLAGQMGVLLDGLMFDKAIAGRMGDDPLLTSLPGKMETMVYKITGLNAWTNANRGALQMTMYQELADNIAKSFEDLPAMLHNQLRLYSITDVDWKMLQKHYAGKDDVLHIAPQHVRQDMGDDALAEKIFAWSDTEARKGVISGSHRTRSAIVRGERGTFSGEFERSFVQVKTFPFEIFMRFLLRIQQDTIYTRRYGRFKNFAPLGWVHYPAKMLIACGSLGYVAMQLKNIKDGKDVESLNSDTVLKAYAHSGGLGFLGDVVYNAMNHVERGHIKDAALDAVNFTGMSLGMVSQGIGAVYSDANKSFKGGQVSVKNTTQFATDWQPFGNVFYLQPFIEAVHYELKAMTDPNFEKRYQRKVRKQEQDGTTYYWPHGDILPERLPEVQQ